MICEKCGLPSGGYPRMSLRDYFAGLAMQGVLSNSTFNLLDDDLEQMSNKFYLMADAMLQARMM